MYISFINSYSNDSLKVCDKGRFIILIVSWALLIVWGIFDTHDVSEAFLVVSVSG